MEASINYAKRIAAGLFAIALMLIVCASPAHAYGANNEGSTASGVQTQAAVTYTYDATPYDAEAYPGVYVTQPVAANSATVADAPSIGIPSIADATLAERPTAEWPAIICGSAVPWGPYGTQEENARAFTDVSPNRVAPYSYFKFGVLNQQGPDGQTLPKLSGFDGTYVIVRIPVAKLFEGHDPATSYLHVSQNKNNALLVAVGMDTTTPGGDRDQWGNFSFSNLFTPTNADGSAGAQFQRKTASYKLSEMYDTTGKDLTTPYFDVILFSTASIVAGADAQKEGALTGDVELSFYVDETADYNKEVNWDPASTDTTLPAKCFAKFFDEEKAKEAGAVISRYTVKGSDLHLETMVDKSDGNIEGGDGTHATFWSLEKSLEHRYYDQPIDKDKTDPNCGRTIMLMSEVPVINNLALEGASATELKKRTLDVNSFDIQIANNTSPKEGEYTSGLLLKNAWLKIADLSNTTGAELAIGNNATMTIETGGKLIVDRTCQLEIEWDGATVAPPAEGETAPAADILNNGSLDLRAGGELQNDGVVTIEGTEGKPYQPDASGTAPESVKGYGELTICEGATFTNNGCFMSNGALYVQGTLVNNGKYNDDPIVSNDPDKGAFTYHRGIQSTWKDDVTQSNIIYGGVYVGMDKTWVKEYKNAVLENNGDIVLCPGELVNMGTVKNAKGANIYVCATDKATIPIEPDPNDPTVVTKEVTFDTPKGSFIDNWSTIENEGPLQPGEVTVEKSGSLGELAVPGRFADCFSLNLLGDGKISGAGYVYKHDLTHATVELRRKAQTYDSVVYNGFPWLFDVIVLVGGNEFMGPNDFKVSYLDPNGKVIEANQVIDAGTYQVVVEGTETCTGTAAKQLVVEPAKLTAATLSSTSFTYDGKVHKPQAESVKAEDLDVPASGYTVTYSTEKPKDAGSYEATVTGSGNYVGAITLPFTVEKAANTLELQGGKAKVKYAKLKKKAQTVKRSAVIAVNKAEGALTYTLAGVAKAKYKKYFSMNASNGNITVKKGLVKGTYKLTVDVAAAGTANYDAVTKTVVCKVKVV